MESKSDGTGSKQQEIIIHSWDAMPSSLREDSVPPRQPWMHREIHRRRELRASGRRLFEGRNVTAWSIANIREYSRLNCEGLS
jgi:hypothetical protein